MKVNVELHAPAAHPPAIPTNFNQNSEFVSDIAWTKLQGSTPVIIKSAIIIIIIIIIAAY
jgi:hypothetical protein